MPRPNYTATADFGSDGFDLLEWTQNATNKTAPIAMTT